MDSVPEGTGPSGDRRSRREQMKRQHDEFWAIDPLTEPASGKFNWFWFNLICFNRFCKAGQA